MTLKVSSAVKQLMYVLKIKLFRVVADSIHSFRIRSKETLRIMYLKYPPLAVVDHLDQYSVFGFLQRITKYPFSD